MPLEVDLVRKVVNQMRFVEEVAHDPVSSTIQYVHTQKGHRINVSYRKGTVVSTKTYPRIGTVQLVRRNVSYSILVELLKNAPAPKDNKPPPASSMLKKRLQRALNDGVNEEAEFEDDFALSPIKTVQPPPQLPPPLPPQPPLPPHTERVESTADGTSAAEKGMSKNSNKVVNARGNNSYWKLRHSKSFPVSSRSVACFAQARGGYVAVFDDGTCVWDGLSATVVDLIASQGNKNIAYIALGEYDQYYLRTKGNDQYFSGPVAFEDSLRHARSSVRAVAFGDSSSYFVLFADGTNDYHAMLPQTALKILSQFHINSVWIGTNFVHNSNGHFISYQGTTGGTLHTYAGLPREVSLWLEKKTVKSTQVKQLLSDGDCFIIRYS